MSEGWWIINALIWGTALGLLLKGLIVWAINKRRQSKEN